MCWYGVIGAFAIYQILVHKIFAISEWTKTIPTAFAILHITIFVDCVAVGSTVNGLSDSCGKV